MRFARVAAVLGLIIALLLPGAASADELGADDIVVSVPLAGEGREITNAQLRWGLNREAGSAAFAGGCNFLSAGRAGNGRGQVWTAEGALYRASAGNVRIEKPTAAGGWAVSSFADRCRDAAGNVVTGASLTSATGNQAVIDGGVGTLLDGGGLEIRWSGSFTVVFYGGLTYWSVSDPVLTLDASGSGRLRGIASGYGASMEDTSHWVELPERSIVLAELRGADIRAAGGFSVVPEYLGVAARDAGQVARTSANAAYWGAFPASFLDYQRLTGQLGYWLTTGGVRDPAKPATAVYVSFDARAPIAVVPPPTSSTDAGAPVNNTRFRPPAPATADAATSAAVAAGTPLTFVPERIGLIPDALAGSLPWTALPLLGSALALLTAIIAVLNMMGLLPWQRGLR